MKEKIYTLRKDELDLIHFTKEKVFCRIRSDEDDINVSWISNDQDFDKNAIIFSQYFNKKAEKNNLLTNKDLFIKEILENYEPDSIEYVKLVFQNIFQIESLDNSLSSPELMGTYDEFFYLVLFYYIVEKCKGNVLTINNITISFKNTRDFIAVDFWSKFFKK